MPQIEKKVKAHNKKQKKGGDGPGTKKSKDIGIPNSYPFKEQVLREMQLRKERVAEELAEKNRLERERRAIEKAGRKALSLEELQADALNRIQQHETVEAATQQSAESVAIDESTERAGFWRELNRVIEMSDVIVEVLDARDPNGCRSKQLEQQVLASGKRLILLVNKIDLIPQENLQKWMTYLSRDHPTKAFKAAKIVQHHTKHVHVNALKATESMLNSNTTVVGAEELIELVKNYARDGADGKTKASITVGIVGYPNVGKSSVINSLLRRPGAVTVGAEAGVTRSLQTVNLDAKVKLVDSPGVVFSKTTDAASVLRNAVKLQNVRDPQSVVEALVRRCPKDLLLRHFVIPDFETPTKFVLSVAHKIGKLRKGGVPDLEGTSKFILQQWTGGKIKFFSFPPQDEFDENAESCIVFSEAPDFSLQ